MLHRTP